MGPAETVAGLTAFERRGAGSDAERRAAIWLAGEIQATDRTARLEPFWCRPNWALTHAWHVAIGLVGSLLSVNAPAVGSALILLTLVSLLADARLGVSLGRRLTPERASQNVIAARRRGEATARVRLLITANYDAGRTGLVYRGAFRTAAARLRVATRGLAPGWIGWLAIALLWLLATAILRLEGTRGNAVGAAQLLPTVALVLALALLLELAIADFGPGAGDNASGVAAALAVTRALQAGPPRNLNPELLLQGAGDRNDDRPAQISARPYKDLQRQQHNRPRNRAVRRRPAALVDQRWRTRARAIRQAAPNALRTAGRERACAWPRGPSRAGHHAASPPDRLVSRRSRSAASTSVVSFLAPTSDQTRRTRSTFERLITPSCWR